MTATEYFNEAFAKDSTDFYISHTIRYLEADEKTRWTANPFGQHHPLLSGQPKHFPIGQPMI